MPEQNFLAPGPKQSEFNTLNSTVTSLSDQLENKVGKYRQNISGHSSITASDISAFLSGYTGYGAVSVDFYRTDNQNIVASMYYCRTNQNYGSGVLVSYYDDGNSDVICSNGTVTIRKIVKYKEVTLNSSTIGTSFSQTSRNVGSASSLFGMSADKICGIVSTAANLSPASNITFGFSGGNLYIATTQSCTLSGNITVQISYT